MATRLAVPLADRSPTPARSPPQQRQQPLDTLVAWLREAAGRPPVLAGWVAVPWAAPSTLELLGLGLEQTPSVPRLPRRTLRADWALPWPARSHLTPITLPRLARPPGATRRRHLVGGTPLPAAGGAPMVATTAGVPLDVAARTKRLLESALLQAATAPEVLTGPLLRVAMSNTVQEALMARLEQRQTAQEVAQRGAVRGREFSSARRQAISSQDEDTLQAGRDQVVAAARLAQRGRLPRAHDLFQHALSQDAASASLRHSPRQQVHQPVAQLWEGPCPDTVAIQLELVVHHSTEAGQTTDALRSWQQAGRHANERASQDAALAHLPMGRVRRQCAATHCHVCL